MPERAQLFAATDAEIIRTVRRQLRQRLGTLPEAFIGGDLSWGISDQDPLTMAIDGAHQCHRPQSGQKQTLTLRFQFSRKRPLRKGVLAEPGSDGREHLTAALPRGCPVNRQEARIADQATAVFRWLS